jgi:hypothetical protein
MSIIKYDKIDVGLYCLSIYGIYFDDSYIDNDNISNNDDVVNSVLSDNLKV